jgi:hypothetical protein
MTRDAAERVARALRASGTDGVHIGGGEPFLDMESLFTTIEALARAGVAVDYIETNAFWCADDARTRDILRKIRALGARCVMASVDPYHIEYVPLERPLRLIDALGALGMDSFIWQERFLNRLLKLDPDRTHGPDELAALLGGDYKIATAREYGLGINGRALRFAEKLYPKRPADALLTAAPCDLLSINHCHVDLYENAIPAGCPGISIGLDDFLCARVPEDTYPVAGRILRGGIKSLYEYARAHGFVPDAYPTKCALCVAMRAYLRQRVPSADLAPGSFYEEMAEVL